MPAPRPPSGRLRLAGLVGLLLVVSACSVEESLPMPDCEEGGSVIIAAQSVPSAELVFCLDRLPVGWVVDSVTVDQDGTEVRLDSDRAGAGAARLHYEAGCSPGEAVPVPTDEEGADRFDFIERVEPGFRARWYYLFQGGCVWWDFDFDDDASAALSIELGDSLMLVSRAVLEEDIRATFVDEPL